MLEIHWLYDSALVLRNNKQLYYMLKGSYHSHNYDFLISALSRSSFLLDGVPKKMINISHHTPSTALFEEQIRSGLILALLVKFSRLGGKLEDT